MYIKRESFQRKTLPQLYQKQWKHIPYCLFNMMDFSFGRMLKVLCRALLKVKGCQLVKNHPIYVWSERSRQTLIEHCRILNFMERSFEIISSRHHKLIVLDISLVYKWTWLAFLVVVQSLSCVWLLGTPWMHTRLPCPSPPPRACSNSCPLSQWYHPTISSSVIPFSSCLQSFPPSGSSVMSLLFVSGSQSIGASTSVLPLNIQG